METINVITILNTTPSRGTVSPEGAVFIGSGESVEITATPNSGYIFLMWVVTENGESRITTENPLRLDFDPRYSTIGVMGNWRIAPTVLILFDSNGGWIEAEHESSFKNIQYGQRIGSLPTPVWSGYSFNGWFTSKTGGTQITPSTIFYGVEDVTYYAHWTATAPQKYSVEFIDPTGTNVTTTRQYDVGVQSNLPTLSSNLGWTVPSGYTVSLSQTWTTSASNGTIYSDGQSIIDIAEEGFTKYLYLILDPVSHTVTFNYDGGEVIESSRSVLHGNQIGRLPETIKNGIKSIGWKISGTQTQVTSTYIVTDNITLVPIWGSVNEEFWSVVRYKIDLVLNGGALDSSYVAKYSKDIQRRFRPIRR